MLHLSEKDKRVDHREREREKESGNTHGPLVCGMFIRRMISRVSRFNERREKRAKREPLRIIKLSIAFSLAKCDNFHADQCPLSPSLAANSLLITRAYPFATRKKKKELKRNRRYRREKSKKRENVAPR